MPSPKRNEKVTCENCAAQTTKPNFFWHKKRCPVGTLYCTKYISFSATSQTDLTYPTAKKHTRVQAGNTHNCKTCLEEFSGFYAVRKNLQLGVLIRTSILDLIQSNLQDNLIPAIICTLTWSLKKEDTVYLIFSMSSFSNSFFTDKLFNQLKFPAKVSLAFGFELKNVEDGTC